MRKNLYELLANMNFNFKEEYKTLLFLFQEDKCYRYRGQNFTLSEFIDQWYFRGLPIRGTFTNLEKLMQAISIKKIATSLEDLFILSELLIALLPEEKTEPFPTIHAQATTIKENIHLILEKTNHQLIELPDATDKYIITEKNIATTYAAEIVDDTSIALCLFEYNHFALRGNLDAKMQILCSIGTYIEPILNSKVLQNAGYKQLESDMGFVLNNFHIRHNNKSGSKKQDYTSVCTDEELEKWYDNAYEMALAVIIINEHLPIASEISNLKKTYHWKS